jgi:hypothetical protein
MAVGRWMNINWSIYREREVDYIGADDVILYLEAENGSLANLPSYLGHDAQNRANSPNWKIKGVFRL